MPQFVFPFPVTNFNTHRLSAFMTFPVIIVGCLVGYGQLKPPLVLTGNISYGGYCHPIADKTRHRQQLRFRFRFPQQSSNTPNLPQGSWKVVPNTCHLVLCCSTHYLTKSTVLAAIKLIQLNTYSFRLPFCSGDDFFLQCTYIFFCFINTNHVSPVSH